MGKEIHIIATITPKPGKADEVIKLLNQAAEQVKANEPGNYFYYGLKNKKANEIIIVEKYQDKDALGAHASSAHFKAWSVGVKDLVEGPSVLKFGDKVAGFDSKL
ncbi:hypothetical protein FQN57_004864 [Myotisia sp. PD_48]|nr:hypothetical protein FQN57_004864 [Myotisia sp. PD_48]